ncbi:hypothetical protein AOQ84DRAFT_220174 [Glonium stellatum]|uniref:Uncharacterized protein n=1 Tax=Glonium stellatum TaxID=574774 RepID=A0A8E2EMG7_9PEZI|nr:hypothetical protein AOQ84DRAFT_220174 [Glonium stellatum]
MSLSEDGLASIWDYAINNPLVIAAAWITALAVRLGRPIGRQRPGSCAGVLLCHSRRPMECDLGSDSINLAYLESLRKASRAANIRSAVASVASVAFVSPLLRLFSHYNNRPRRLTVVGARPPILPQHGWSNTRG